MTLAPTYEAFATRVRAARRRSDLTQAETADRAGISLRTYSRIEGGHGPPSAKSLIRLAEVLDTTVQYLAGDADAPALRRVEVIGEDHLHAEVLRAFFASTVNHDVTAAEQTHLIEYQTDRHMTFSAYAFVLAGYRAQLTEAQYAAEITLFKAALVRR